MPSKYKYRKWLQQHDKKRIDKLKKDLSESFSFSISSDVWLSSFGSKIIAVASTYIKNKGDKLEFCSSLLSIRHIEISQTKINTTNTLKNILNEYQVLIVKIIKFTSDNRQNFALSCDGIPHYR